MEIEIKDKKRIRIKKVERGIKGMPQGQMIRLGEVQPYWWGHYKGDISQTPPYASSITKKIPSKDEAE
jgi:hypothetical protein